MFEKEIIMGAATNVEAGAQASDSTAVSVAGKLDTVIYARLAPGADIYRELKRICKEHDIRTGVVMTITGALEKARVQLLTTDIAETGSPLVLDIPGPVEVSGHGLIGTMRQSNSGGLFEKEEEGSAYLHVHLTLTVGTGDNVKTVCGHMMEGCTVRAKHLISHFTIVIGKATGVALDLVMDREHILPGYPQGYRYHSLTKTHG